MRVDVVALPAVEGKDNTEQRNERKRVDVWQTFRGNEWDNKGEWLGGGTLEQGGITINVGVLAERAFYEARPGCESSSLARDRQRTLTSLISLSTFTAQKPDDINWGFGYASNVWYAKNPGKQ